MYRADAWYCILEGTDQVAVAEGQARALVDLLATFAVRGPVKREILLAVDESITTDAQQRQVIRERDPRSDDCGEPSPHAKGAGRA